MGTLFRGAAMRLKIYHLVSKSDKRSVNYIYDIFIGFISFLSILPLMFKREFSCFDSIDNVTVVILAFDYILRFLVSDYIIRRKWQSFIIYPFTIGGFVDLLSLLPFGRVFRVLRIFKLLRYMDFFLYIMEVYSKVRKILFTVLAMALFYIFITALLMFNVESQSFNNFFESLYWATTALTTVGYGDIYPKTIQGRIVSMVSSVFGMALVALPSGVITANIIKELNKKEENK